MSQQSAVAIKAVIPAHAGIHVRKKRGLRIWLPWVPACAGTTLVTMAFFALAMGAVSAAPRGSSGDPDWPCQQVKVPELSVAAIWPEPLPEKTADAASDLPGLSELVAKLAARKTPVEEAEKDIAAFVTGTPEERKKKADLLFIGLFNALNAQRSQVMNGIERAYRKQKDFAGKIRADTEKLRELQDAECGRRQDHGAGDAGPMGDPHFRGPAQDADLRLRGAGGDRPAHLRAGAQHSEGRGDQLECVRKSAKRFSGKTHVKTRT